MCVVFNDRHCCLECGIKSDCPKVGKCDEEDDNLNLDDCADEVEDK
jgi:hypothetical protein